jgi:hypothetical protein
LKERAQYWRRKKNENEEEEERLGSRSIPRRATATVAPYYSPRTTASLSPYIPPWQPTVHVKLKDTLGCLQQLVHQCL